MSGRLLAISDLHVGYAENRRHVDALRPGHDDDWLLIAGDVAEKLSDVEWALAQLSSRFATVVWSPGNHELWTMPSDPDQARGVDRYQRLVAICRRLGVLTPEDPYPVWSGAGGPVRVAPLFILYDYSFRLPEVTSKEESLAAAYEAGVVCTDEAVLHPDPYPSREAWCRARVEATLARLVAVDQSTPFVLMNHWPLVREPTRLLRYQVFAQWCGTELTADWHTRFPVAAMVYGHLHIPRTTWHDGIRFEEVSVGYPREWRRFGGPAQPRVILPLSAAPRSAPA